MLRKFIRELTHKVPVTTDKIAIDDGTDEAKHTNLDELPVSTQVQTALDNKRRGSDKIVENINLVVGQYLHVCSISNISYASIAGTIDSEFFSPSFKMDLFHVYNDIKYEFGLTHYTLAVESQFDQLVFTQVGNGDPIEVYLRIGAVHTPPSTSNIGLSGSYTITDAGATGLTLRGNIVSSVSNVKLTVIIDAKDFRSTNVGSVGNTFISLSDTPTDYTGKAGTKLLVNDTEDGLEFVNDVTLGTVEYRYRFDTGTDTSVDPTDGHIRVNNTDYSLVTEIASSDTDRTGENRNGAFMALNVGDVFIIRDANTDKGIVFKMTAKVTDNGSWFTMSVQYMKDTPPAMANERCIIGFIYLGKKNFIELDDTPDTYTGKANQIPIVNVAEDGLHFIPTVASSGGWTAYTGTMPIFSNTTEGKDDIVFPGVDLTSTQQKGDWLRITSGAGTHIYKIQFIDTASGNTGMYVVGEVSVTGTITAVDFSKEYSPQGAKIWESQFVARAHNITNNVIGENTEYNVPLTAEDFDPNNNFDNSEYVIPVTGKYTFDGRWSVDGNLTADIMQAIIRKNDTSDVARNISGVNNAYCSKGISGMAKLNRGDVINLAIWQGAGSAITLKGETDRTFLAINFVGI